MHAILINNALLFKINALLNIQMFNTLCVPNFIFESLQVFFGLISVTQLQVNPEESYKLLYSSLGFEFFNLFLTVAMSHYFS